MPHRVSRYASTLVSNTYPHGYLEGQGNLKRGKCMQPHLPCCLPLYFEGILLASASSSKTPCIANICCNRTLRVLHAGAAVAWQSLLIPDLQQPASVTSTQTSIPIVTIAPIMLARALVNLYLAPKE